MRLYDPHYEDGHIHPFIRLSVHPFTYWASDFSIYTAVHSFVHPTFHTRKSLACYVNSLSSVPGNSLCRSLWAVGRDRRQERAALTEGLCKQRRAHRPLKESSILHTSAEGLPESQQAWAIIRGHDLARASIETIPSSAFGNPVRWVT